MWAALPWYYRDADGIDDLTKQLPELFPELCSLIELPFATRGGRTVYGVRIGKPRGPTDAILLTGNVHARELGASEFCAYFAYNLCQAYAEHDELRCGNKTFSFNQIRTIVEQLELIVVPCTNPDGRDWVFKGRQLNDHGMMLWRGNRQLDGGDGCYGVDLNRNQPFLWDFEHHFLSAASVDTSANPCAASQTYRGATVASEPEAQNISWLFEHFPFIYAYIDFHAAHGAMVYPWGHEFSQTTDPNQNFQNPAFDALRSAQDGNYSEYIPADDLESFQLLGRAFASALAAVRGKVYSVTPSIELGGTPTSDPHAPGLLYKGTTGANDDYAYSRHFVDSNKAKVLAFTVEFGEPIPFNPSDDQSLAGFQPSMALDMPAITEDLIAGTLGFCLQAKASVPSQVWIILAAVAAVLAAIFIALLQSCG